MTPKQVKVKNLILFQTKRKKNESVRRLITAILREEVTKEKVKCDKCGWTWKLSEGGKDPYTCHECGYVN
jgi:hypothetical protein